MHRPTTVVCATANPHKLAELTRLLGAAVSLLPRPDDIGEIEESGATLVDNAVLKARIIARTTGSPALADDTGLEVDALAGAPGVHSARFGGPGATDADNRQMLLGRLRGIGATGSGRTGRFRTVIALAWPDGSTWCFEGVCRGTISDTERGAGGFGYDAVFVPDAGDGRTFAEMSSAEKDATSHRRAAVSELLAWLTAADRPD